MKATEAQIGERLPVWKTLSELFLDTKLDQDDLERIAEKLAASCYTEDQLEDILICEVCPGCRINALSPAGEWAFFDEDWLIKRIEPQYGKQIRFKNCSSCGIVGCMDESGRKSGREF